MDDVAAREIPVYFEVEEEIISAGAKVTRNDVLGCTARSPSCLVPAFVSLLSEVCIAHPIVTSGVFSRYWFAVEGYHRCDFLFLQKNGRVAVCGYVQHVFAHPRKLTTDRMGRLSLL